MMRLLEKNRVNYNLELSVTEDLSNKLIKIRQSDDETQIFNVELTENAEVRGFEGLTPFFCLFPRNTTGQGLTEEPVQEFDEKKGTLKYTLSPNAWQYVGRNEAYFSFRKQLPNGEWDEQYSTKMFIYQVEKSIYQIKFFDSNYWWTFKELKRQFQGWIDSSKNYWNNFLLSVKDTIESIDGGGNVLEISEFKFSKMLNKWFPTMKDRGDFWDETLNNRAFDMSWIETDNESKRVELFLNHCINHSLNGIVKKGVYTCDDMKINGSSNFEIEIDFNGSTLITDQKVYNDFLLDLKLKNVTIKNLIIDGLDFKNKLIFVSETENSKFKNVRLKNAKVPSGFRGSAIGFQVDVSTCSDIDIDILTINEMSANDNGEIGGWDGACKGLLFTGDSITDNSNKNITVNNLKISNLSSEDADGLHIQNCGLFDLKVTNYQISDCDSRMIKIQETWGMDFFEGLTFNSTNHSSRRAHISDYSGGNSFRKLNMRAINAVHGLEIIPSAKYEDMIALDEIKGKMTITENSIDGEVVSPILVSALKPTDILKNYRMSNIEFLSKAKGVLIYAHSINLTLDTIGIYGSDSTGKLADAVTLSSFYNAESGQKASHVNLRASNIWASNLPIYFSADTTFRFSEFSQLKSIAGLDPYIVLTSNANNDIVIQPRFFRMSAPPTTQRGVMFNQGDIILLTRPLNGHSIWAWTCVESGDPGKWKAINYG